MIYLQRLTRLHVLLHRLRRLTRTCVVSLLQVNRLSCPRILRCSTWVSELHERRAGGSTWRSHRSRYWTIHFHVVALHLMTRYAGWPWPVLHSRTMRRRLLLIDQHWLSLHGLQWLAWCSLYYCWSASDLSVHGHTWMLLRYLRL